VAAQGAAQSQQTSTAAPFVDADLLKRGQLATLMTKGKEIWQHEVLHKINELPLQHLLSMLIFWGEVNLKCQ